MKNGLVNLSILECSEPVVQDVITKQAASKILEVLGKTGRGLGREGMDAAKTGLAATGGVLGGAGAGSLAALGLGMGNEGSEGYLDNLGAATGGGIVGGASALPAGLLIEKILGKALTRGKATPKLVPGLAGLLGGGATGLGAGYATRDALYG